MIPGPQKHKTITDSLFLFVSFDNRGFNKAAGGENKTPHMGPDLTLEKLEQQSASLFWHLSLIDLNVYMFLYMKQRHLLILPCE